jgi:tetratricopeptide (TPR) repeat protein
MAFGGESAESYYDEGLTASMTGDMVHAIQFFQKSIQLDREFLAARHQLGRALTRVGRNEQAVGLLREVVARKPDNLAARADLGYANLGMGLIPEAREQFNFIVMSDAESPRGFLGLAETFFDEGNWNAAVMQAQEALKRGGQTFQVLFLIGRAARLQGDSMLSKESLESAEALLEQSAETSPEQPEAHYLRGEVYFVREQYSAALDHYRAAESRCVPGKMYAAFGQYFGLLDAMAKQGLCYRRQGQLQRAKDIAERILKADPEHKLAKSLLE